MANDINNFPLAGKPLGGAPAAATAIKDTEHNADHQGLSDLPGVRYIRGANCADKASAAIRCEIWLQASNALGATTGNREVADAGCPVRVYYNGTHKWTTTTQVVGADVFIVFTDAECNTHAAPGIGDYSNAGFIAALHIFIDTYPSGTPVITAGQLLASNTAPDGINGDNIPRGPAGVAGSMEEGLADVETDVGSVIAPGGGLLADVISGDQLDISANVDDSDENLVYGRMEEDDDGDGIVNTWVEYMGGAGGTFDLDNTHYETGLTAQRVQAAGPAQGIQTTPAWPHLTTDHKGKSVTAHVRVWTTDAASVYVRLHDGVGPDIVSPASGVAGGWTTITIRQDRDAAATNFVVSAYSAFGPTTFWIDSVKVSLGVTAKAVSLNPWGIAYDVAKTGDYQNWILNSDFDKWTNAAVGGIQYPDWWGPGVNPPAASAQDLVNFVYGNIGWQLNMNAGQSVTAQFPIPRMQVGELGYLTGYIFGIAGVSPVRITLPMGGFGYDTIPTIGAWRRFIIPVDAAFAIWTTFDIEIGVPAGNNNFVISGLTFNRGRVPIAFKPANPKIYKWDFHWPGGVPGVPVNLFLNSGQLDALIPAECWVHKIMAYNNVAPGGVLVDTYDVMQNGAVSGLATTITGAALIGGTQVGFTAGVPPISFAQYDRLQVQLTDGGGASGDISCVVEAIGY